MQNSNWQLSNTERPTPAPPAKSSRILEGLSGFVLLAGLIYAVVTFIGLPETVPVHFGPDGTPDDWGSKNQFLLAPLMLFLTSLLCLVLARYPRLHNMPKTPSSEAGWQALYTCSRNMILWMSIGIGFILVEITYSTAHPENSGPFIWVLLVLILLPMFYYIPKMLKIAR